MESQPQNPEFRNNPETFETKILSLLLLGVQVEQFVSY